MDNRVSKNTYCVGEHPTSAIEQPVNASPSAAQVAAAEVKLLNIVGDTFRIAPGGPWR